MSGVFPLAVHVYNTDIVIFQRHHKISLVSPGSITDRTRDVYVSHGIHSGQNLQ